jgi:hypothetical protein
MTGFVGVPSSTFQVDVVARVNVELGTWNVAVGSGVAVGVPRSRFPVGVGNGVFGATVVVGMDVGVNLELGTWNVAVGAGVEAVGPQPARPRVRLRSSRKGKRYLICPVPVDHESGW